MHKRFPRWAEAGVWDRLFADPGGRPEESVLDAGLDHRSRGGLSTRIGLLANGLGEPVALRLTGGQAGEFAEAPPLLASRQAKIVMADRGYDSNAIVTAIQSIGAEAVIPSSNAASTT